jgi:hypothetical protein
MRHIYNSHDRAVQEYYKYVFLLSALIFVLVVARVAFWVFKRRSRVKLE